MAEPSYRRLLAPHVWEHVDVVLRKGFIGLSRERVSIQNLQTSCSSLNKNNSCDRFMMVVPYAGTSVQFFVIFQASEPECPPDFLFTNFEFFPPLDKMETLRDWDFRKSDGLYRVLKELLDFYKSSHMHDLITYSYLNSEFLSMFEIRNFSQNDYEVFVPSKNKGAIMMLIRLHVEFCDILLDESKKSVKESALLLILFSGVNNMRLGQRLFLSKEVNDALGINDGDFELPSNSEDYKLKRYVLACEDNLRSRVNLVISFRKESRKAYFSKFLSHWSSSIIEYDVENFQNMVLLLEVEGFHVIVEIELPINYPLGIPHLIFYTANGVPTPVKLAYPYKLTWSLDKVFTETVKFIETHVRLLSEKTDSLF